MHFKSNNVQQSANSGAFSGAGRVELAPSLLFRVMLALLCVFRRAIFLSRLDMRSLSSLLLQGSGLIQRTLGFGASTSESESPSISESSVMDSSEDINSFFMQGKYLALSASAIVVEFCKALLRFSRFYQGNKYKRNN